MKKIFLGPLATMAAVATPIALVVSCGNTQETKDFYAQLDKIQKPQTVEEYKKAIKKEIQNTFFKDNNGTPLEAAVFAAFDKETDEAKFKAEAIKIQGFHKVVADEPTVVEINGTQFKLKSFVEKPKLKIIAAGNKEQKSTPVDQATKDKWISEINALTGNGVSVVSDWFYKKFVDGDHHYFRNESNTGGMVDASNLTNDAGDANGLKQAKKAAIDRINNEVMFKDNFKAKSNTIVSINGQVIDLGSIVTKPTIKVITPGKPKVTTWSKTIVAVGTVKERMTLKKFIKEVNNAFVNSLTIFEDQKGNKFTDVTTEVGNGAQSAEEVLKKAKEIPVFSTSQLNK